MSTTRKKATKPEQEATAKTAVPTQISRDHWFTLRSVALHRSMKLGRRVTLTDLLAEIIERARPDLEKELRD